MRFLKYILFLAVITTGKGWAQPIIQAEYFFNSDPGTGNGHPIQVSPGYNTIIPATLSATEMSSGLNYLFVRTKTTSGKWSLSEPYAIQVENVILAAEYFYDSDPGVGNGIPIPVASLNDTISLNAVITTAGLSSGTHYLFIRTMDANDKWSLSEPYALEVENVIMIAEYFFDSDPGIGNGVVLPVSVPDVSININSTIATDGLTGGIHYLFIRTLDANNKWSLSEPYLIQVENSIRAAEYFYDSDPGIGNGIAIAVSVLNDTVSLNSAISAAGLTSGMHYLFIRTRDANNLWSLSEPFAIQVENVITAAEYFFDSDPGIGNGNALPLAALNDSVNIFSTISTAGLGSGVHYLFVRTLDANNKWSLSEPYTIEVQNAILAAEYFFNSDPGIGNGIALTVSAPYDTVNINSTISTAGLGSGTHYLFIRTRDANTSWSLSEPFTIQVENVVLAAEYFLDSDPGPGNATPVNIISNDSTQFSITLPPYAIPDGQHFVFVRTLDANGRWSLPEPFSVIGNAAPVAELKLFIQGFYTGNSTMVAVADPVNNPDLCDTITVQLRQALPPYQPVTEAKVLLDIHGHARLYYPQALFGDSYYLVIRHRNSLETWSKQPILLGQDSIQFDFSSGVTSSN